MCSSSRWRGERNREAKPRNEWERKGMGCKRSPEEFYNSEVSMWLLNTHRIDTRQMKYIFQLNTWWTQSAEPGTSAPREKYRKHQPKWTHTGTLWTSKQPSKWAWNFIKESFYNKAQPSQQLQKCVLLRLLFTTVFMAALSLNNILYQ